MKPMLARLQDKPFVDPRYIWEPKYDGIRIIATVNPSYYELQARSGADKTKLFPELELKTKLPAVLDGELVSSTGKFNGIQHRANRINGIARAIQDYPVTYEVFDVVELQGVNLQRTPLSRRKDILEEVLIETSNVSLTPYTDDGVKLFDDMLAAGKEGIMGKLLSGTYREDKRDWLKVKCNQTDEFVICGYTPGTGWRASTFGALVLGKQDGDKLTYVGSVGTGFDDQEIAALYKHLLELQNDICPFGYPPEPAVWVMPEMVIKVRFLEYTNDSRLRFPAYKGRV